MKLTLQNFAEVRKKVIEHGIQKIDYTPNGQLISFTTGDGLQYEFDPTTLEEFKRAGLAALAKGPVHRG